MNSSNLIEVKEQFKYLGDFGGIVLADASQFMLARSAR